MRLLVRYLMGVALGLLLSLATVVDVHPGEMPVVLNAPNENVTIALEEQPFYDDLLIYSANWDQSYLGKVTGLTPQQTLLRFYAVMARVGEIIRDVSQQTDQHPGLIWGQEAQDEIREAEVLFRTAKRTLDDSSIPESIRKDTQEESVLKLKEILDYAFANSREPIEIPNDKEKTDWTMPGTAITLTRSVKNDTGNQDYFFSQETLENINRMYGFVRDTYGRSTTEEIIANNPLASPRIFEDFSYSPGYLVPPKWYVSLPESAKRYLQTPFGEQSLLQYLMTALLLLIYIPVVLFCAVKLLNTYRYNCDHSGRLLNRFAKRQVDISWRRFFLALPIAPLSVIAKISIANRINFTGVALKNSNSFFDIVAYISLGVTIVLFFEAIASSSAVWILKFRGSQSELEKRRLRNLILPFSRFLGAIGAVILIYQLMLRLGMPPNAVIAFSAVPGLAVGLGGSRLLGNLFAGIAIQSDRPVRVGEFCKIGSEMGFVSRIGLRSIDMITLSGRITIPNNKVEDEIIKNYSDRQHQLGQPENSLSQGIELVMDLPANLGVGQLNGIVERITAYIEENDQLDSPVVSFSEDGSSGELLTVFAKACSDNWKDYLQLKQDLSAESKTVIAIVNNLKHSISIAYDTPSHKRQHVPSIIRDVVESDKQLKLGPCRLSALSDYSLDFTFFIESTYDDTGAFFDAIARIKEGLLQAFEANEIEIPLPTSIEIHKSVPMLSPPGS